MRDATIARNYAEALLELARQAKDLPGWGNMMNEVAAAVENDAKLRLFLESPRVDAAKKNEVLRKAYGDRVPLTFLRFLQTLVRNRRQMLFPAVAQAYADLVDEAEGRMHADVTMSSEPSESERVNVAQQLGRAFGKEVVPHFSVNPEIMGGVVVRVGDTVLDGSVRKRLSTLRSKMLGRR
ncbi:MAG: synthase subunit delta [Gemmatimonadetes bacterium]|nr:synthase subunit delta [Gemmatimonadota bacterium]